MPVRTTGELLAGRYRVERRLGSGGMATVFLARDERLGRPVALKRLHADSPEEVGRRFVREAKVGASLNHPNVVSVYDTVTDDEGVLIVMEYVEGETLRDEIASGARSPERAIELLAGVAAALDHAHEHGVIHRDVKPANVLIARNGMVKLADLGIATAAEHTRITHSGTVLGTAAYMAPERLDGRAGGPPVDVYALAAVAFEALSGRKAFTGSTAMEIARRVATQEPPDLAEVVPGAPRRAGDVLRRAMAKDPAARPASAGELVRELSAAYAETAQRSTAALSTPPPPPRPAPQRAMRGPRRGSLAVLAVLAAVAAIALVAALGSGGGGSSPSRASSASSPKTAGASRHRAQRSRAAGGGQQQAPPAASNSGAGAPAGAASPQDAITQFYTRTAQKDFAGAWALGTDRLHTQLVSLAAFSVQEQTLQSIAFPQLRVASQSADGATVQFQSVARHSDRTDVCQGQIATVRGAGGWMVDQLQSVNCAHQPNGSAAAPGPHAPPGPKGDKAKGGKDHGHGGGNGGGD